MQAELAEWRTGKRRVYWAVGPEPFYGAGAKRAASGEAQFTEDKKFMRITVGPRGNVRPWGKK